MTARLLRYIKLSPIMMTSILFRTGSIALSFLALRAYGAIVVVLFLVVLAASLFCVNGFPWLIYAPLNAFTSCFYVKMDKKHICLLTWLPYAIYSTALIVAYSLDPKMTYLGKDDIAFGWAKDPWVVLPSMLSLGLLSCVLTEIYSRCSNLLFDVPTIQCSMSCCGIQQTEEPGVEMRQTQDP